MPNLSARFFLRASSSSSTGSGGADRFLPLVFVVAVACADGAWTPNRAARAAIFPRSCVACGSDPNNKLTRPGGMKAHLLLREPPSLPPYRWQQPYRSSARELRWAPLKVCQTALHAPCAFRPPHLLVSSLTRRLLRTAEKTGSDSRECCP